ncbi:MAG: DJ-1/PfpI family protein [Actinomycetota bacterium]|nr:DJ-1/PfpI family protein [Actinomycetota bacterium]
MRIAIPLFEGMTALDAVGPYEVLSRVPAWELTFVADEPGPKRTDNDLLTLTADTALADMPDPDVMVVPGGAGTRTYDNDELVEWIRSAHERTRWTTSVCTGSLLLGKAGVLQGLRATSHWLWLEKLREYGAEPTGERVVEQGKVITAAGVSSGIDMALRLVQIELGDEAAQAIQLSIEYDPEPPVDAGSPAKAPQAIVDLVRQAGTALETP